MTAFSSSDPGVDAVHSLESRTVRVESAVENLRGEIHGIHSKLDKIERAMTAGRSVNWQALSIMLTLVAMAATLLGYIFSDIKASLQDHLHAPGHLPSMLEAAEQRGRIDTLQSLHNYHIKEIDDLRTRVRDLEISRKG